jgi:tRNA threonylcarbamoyladenosine biosynthesis protein TsaE
LRAIEVHPPIVKTPADGLAVAPGNLLVHGEDWSSEDETRRCAQRLASRPQIRDAFISLQGELGAGKTTFVRHLLRALGVTGRVKSPTYAVLEPHEAKGSDGQAIAVSHFDFYRFDSPREFDDAGFRDLFAATGLKLAEWPEKAAGVLPVADLEIRIEVLDDGRRHAVLRAATATGRALLQRTAVP